MLSDDHNLSMFRSTDFVDGVNKKFYEKYPYPQTPIAFYAPADPYFETIMLNQSIGSWDHADLPADLKIWVAGCGTNQALYTALRFPKATIFASDLSESSLAASAAAARRLEITNVEFGQGSINDSKFRGEFDYVICTGVIHHNADPLEPLSRLAGSLKPSGILELMVYNRYHRTANVAFQKALRILAAESNFDGQERLARKMGAEIKSDNLIARLLHELDGRSDAEIADALIQPVEHTYTVDSLELLAAKGGLEIIAPCINQFDKAQGAFSWNMEFDDQELAARYDSLSDLDRWKISNHLLLKKSPMLWFYLRRSDSGRPRNSEKELCQQFLNRRFVRSETRKKHYFKTNDGSYRLNPRSLEYPGVHPEPLCRKILEEIVFHPALIMGEILRKSGLEDAFPTVNKLRLSLTTNAFPFLICVR